MDFDEAESLAGGANPAMPNASLQAHRIDGIRFRTFLNELGSALRRPSAAPVQDESLPAPVGERLSATISLVADAARRRLADGQPTGSGLVPTLDAARAHKVKSLLLELSELRRFRVAMAIGPRRAAVLRALLAQATPDLLGIFRKEHDENAHSDVLRWLMDPREAPSVAPVLLSAIAARLPAREQLRPLLSRALEIGAITVRREVVVGQRDGDQANLDRIDLVVTGPGFVLGIENKVNAAEHEGQTRGYARWLQSIPHHVTAGVFLSPAGVPAASRYFSSVSYLELATWLLEAASKERISTAENHVLCAYFKTLESSILRTEINAIRRMEETL